VDLAYERSTEPRFADSRIAAQLTERIDMSFGLYILGFVIVIGGMIYGAALLHAPVQWIVVGSIILLGFAILTGVKHERQKDAN
jgi:hypothetical protein